MTPKDVLGIGMVSLAVTGLCSLGLISWVQSNFQRNYGNSSVEEIVVEKEIEEFVLQVEEPSVVAYNPLEEVVVSDDVEFVSSEKSKGSREGFEYRVRTPLGADFMTPHTERIFSVERSSGKDSYCMQIWNEGERGNESAIYISDTNRDLIPNFISVRDKVNNSEMRLSRKDDGSIEFSEPFRQEDAEQVYQRYAAEFRSFFEENNLVEKIAEYKPKLEIKQYGEE